MKKNITLFVLIFFYSFIKAQEPKFADKEFYLVDSLVLEELPIKNIQIIDSCLNLFHKTDNDTLKLKYISKIIESTYSDVWHKYQKIATKITEEKLSKNITEKEKKTFLFHKAGNLNNEAYWLASKGKLAEATALCEEAISIQRSINKRDQLATQLANLGNNYYKQGKITKAISTYEESVLLAKKTKDDNTSYIMSNLAMIYHNLDRNNEAIKFLNEALTYDNSDPNSYQRSLIYSDLGTITKSKFQDYKKALFYHNKSLAINTKLNDVRQIASDHSLIGEIYLQQKKPDTAKALKHIRTSLKLNIQLDNIAGLSSDYLNLSKIFLKQKNIDSALVLGKKAYANATKTNAPKNIRETSKNLSNIFEIKKEYQNAFAYHKEYLKMSDSLTNKENTFALAKAESKLQFEKEKELENIKHEAEILLKEKEAEKQTLYKRFFVFGSIILAIVLIFIIRQLFKSNKQRSIIETSNLKLEKQHEEITSSIVYAQRIQNAILPPVGALQEVISNSFVAYQPKDIVSGDFYWIEQSENKIHLAVADCTGHGVPGAMVSVICNNGLNRSVREFQLQKTNEILDKTREIVIQEFEKSGEDIKDGMDISLISIDFDSNKLEFSGANNPVWIIRQENKELELIELKGDKQPIGNYENAFPFTCKTFDLRKDDSIYLSSDGYADQFGGEKNKKIKTANFKKLLIQLNSLEMNTQQEKLQVFFDDWKGDNEQLDDVCVVGIKI